MSSDTEPAMPASPIDRPRRAAVASLVFMCLVAGVMQAVFIPVQGELPQLLDAPRDLAAWVVTVTAVSASTFTSITGRVGDLLGRKRVALALMIVLVGGSLLGALAPNVGLVIAGRALQGISVGVIPLSISILNEMLAGERLVAAIALASGTLAVGSALGQPFGALIVAWLGWRGLFVLSGVLGVIAICWMFGAIPRSTHRTPGRFDVWGAIGVALGSTALILGLAQGMEWGWGSGITIALLVAGPIVLLFVNLAMLRNASPLIDVRMALARPVLVTNVVAAVYWFGTGSMGIVLAQLLVLSASGGTGLGIDPIAVGFVTMSTAVSQALVTPLVARLGIRRGPRFLLIAGGFVLAAVYAGLAAWHGSVWIVLAANLLAGVGISMVFTAYPQILMSAVPEQQTAEVNGLNTQIRQFGGATGIAVAGGLLAFWSTAEGPTAFGVVVSLVMSATAVALGTVIAFAVPRRGDRAVRRRARPAFDPLIQPTNGAPR